MRNEAKELMKLKSLLETRRLSWSERLALEAKVRELEKAQFEPEQISLPGVFGVFDRPKPATSDPDPDPTDTTSSSAGKSPPETNRREPSSPQAPADSELSPGEVEVLAEKISGIADRITALRAFWATTLAVEVDREAEVWLARLQELTKALPDEIAELILDNRKHLLRQKVRDISKPRISQKIQHRLLAPSAPSMDPAGTMSELYYAIHQPRVPHAPQQPVGYVPDGLQQFL